MNKFYETYHKDNHSDVPVATSVPVQAHVKVSGLSPHEQVLVPTAPAPWPSGPSVPEPVCGGGHSQVSSFGSHSHGGGGSGHSQDSSVASQVHSGCGGGHSQD